MGFFGYTANVVWHISSSFFLEGIKLRHPKRGFLFLYEGETANIAVLNILIIEKQDLSIFPRGIKTNVHK